MKTEIVRQDSDFFIYQDDNGIINVNVRLDGKSEYDYRHWLLCFPPDLRMF